MNRYRNRGRGGNQGRMGPKEMSRNRTSVLRRVEEDAHMADSPQSSSCWPRNRKNKLRINNHRQGRALGSGNLMSRLGLPVRGGRSKLRSSHHWCKVTVPYAKQHGREKILEALEAALDAQIFPVMLRIEGSALLFFLENTDQGEALQHMSKRATLSTGQKLTIHVNPSDPPFHPLQPQEIELIKKAMSSRFNPDTAHLDLSRFSSDPVLLEEGGGMSLQRNNVMIAVGKLVQENCPHVRSMDLSGNRIRFLDFMGGLSFQARNVRILNLSLNQIEGVMELEKLGAWKYSLQDLDLDNNPLCNKFNDADKYKSAVQRVFPALTKLDGTNVTPKSTAPKFGIDEAPAVSIVPRKDLPLFKPSFFSSPELQKLIETFLMEFLKLYDADTDWASSRQQLHPAYDADATFTLVIQARHPDARYTDFELFREYQQDSHNILNENRWRNYRAKIVNRGAINVISHFTRLPRTQHIHQSIQIDVSFITNALMCFTAQGLFRDGPHAHTESKEIRFFSRSFLVVPRGQGISVVNDMLLVSPMSPEKVEEYMGMVPLAPPPPQVPLVPPVVATPVETRELMMLRFAEMSRMKKEWAAKCLEDNDWNYDLAAHAFELIKTSIPAEAFQ